MIGFLLIICFLLNIVSNWLGIQCLNNNSTSSTLYFYYVSSILTFIGILIVAYLMQNGNA